MAETHINFVDDAEELHTSNFFALQTKILSQFKQTHYPWEIIPLISKFCEDFFKDTNNKNNTDF